MPHLTRSEKAQVYIDYKNKPVRDVLAKWGLSRRALYKMVGERKRGVRSRKVDDRIASIIVTMNFKGKSDHKIAEMTGLSQDTITRYRNKIHVPPVTENKGKRKNG